MHQPRTRVVVINDTQEILELFGEILRGMDLDPVLMSFAPDDLRQITDVDPGLVIVDFMLGGREGEGWQLLQKLRMQRDTQQVPIIACTAAVDHVRQQEGYLLDQGVWTVLKPFTIEQLENVVRKALAHEAPTAGNLEAAG